MAALLGHDRIGIDPDHVAFPRIETIWVAGPLHQVLRGVPAAVGVQDNFHTKGFQLRDLLELHLVGQPLEGGPAVIQSTAMGHGLSIQVVVRLTPDVVNQDGHVLCHAPWIQQISIKASQGTTGNCLGAIVRRLDGSEADLCMSLEHDGRSSYNGPVHHLHKVGLFQSKHVEQVLGSHACHNTCPCWVGRSHPWACPAPPHCKCHTTSVGPSERYHIADDVLYQQITMQGHAMCTQSQHNSM